MESYTFLVGKHPPRLRAASGIGWGWDEYVFPWEAGFLEWMCLLRSVWCLCRQTAAQPAACSGDGFAGAPSTISNSGAGSETARPLACWLPF